ncbi:MAG: diguanylate cyclase [Candidatus Hydrogenedentes bacterium]|nr:diguanylate cyclase [Candidatus Hydrogenedentota bacterium]MDK1020770.1 diguanylate cyclase [Candidatus Hydrogenedentota bacterium]
MGDQNSIVIISQSPEERQELQSMLESAGHSVEGRDAAPDLMVQREEPGVDLYVVSLPADFQPALQEPGSLSRVARKRVLYITPNASGSMRRELFRAGAADVLTHPLKKIDLQYRAERILAANWMRFRKEFDEPAMLKFVKELLDARIETIEPALDPQMPTGHFYPAVANILGRSSMDRECLEKLAGLGLLGREVANRVRLCPECDDSRLNYRETCPKCNSLNILQQEMVTHFSCAHSAPLQHFRRGGNLVCPKCDQSLRHIGVDYEKPSQLFTCFSCEFVFRDPAVETQCLRCNCTCTPSQTIELTVYSFIVTPLAEQALIEGQISGVNLEMLLRNTQTGLYSKPYFEHEIRRELVRTERYQSPFSMLLVRIDNFEEITSLHPSEATQFAESIFKAVSSGLRMLDTTCVWDIDTLGVLLSATDKARSREVVRRIQDDVHKLEFLYSIREPSVTISLVSSEDGHTDAAALTSAALTDLQE